MSPSAASHAVELSPAVALSTGRAKGASKAKPRRSLTTDHVWVRIAVGTIASVATIAVVAVHRGDPTTAALLAVAILFLGSLSAIDLAEQRLPNRLTLPFAGGTAVLLLLGGFVGSAIGSSLVALAVGLGFAALFVVLRFGMGDVKLSLTVGMIAGWLGPDAITATAYAGAIAGAVAAVLLMVVHRRRDVTFPFGPVLAVGSVAGMLVGTPAF